jgi:hypothetical protein
MRRLLVLGTVAMMLAACATKYSHEGFVDEVLVQRRPDAIPPNYRQLIARDVLALRIDQQRLGTALIATPYNKPNGWWGRLSGTTVPVVCVSFERTNIFGQQIKAYLLFSFENGKPYKWPVPGTAILTNECGTFSPFYEVSRVTSSPPFRGRQPIAL